MVLKLKILKLRYLVVGYLCVLPQLEAQSAIVAGIFKYRVVNPNCTIKQKTEDGWIPFRSKLAKGDLAIGKPNSKNPSIIIFKTPKGKQTLLAAKKSCIFGDRTSSGKSGSDEGDEKYDLESQTRALFSMGVHSWQELISISQGDIKSSLRASSIAAFVGVGFLSANDKRELGVNFQILYAKAQVLNSAEPSDTDIIYSVKNVDVAGAIISPQFFTRPSSGSVAFGVSVPIFLRFGAYPLGTDSTYKIGPRFKPLLGLNIESRFERGGLFFGQKVGFYGAPRSLSWSLETGWKF